jgi:hypothetical protein
MQCITDKCIQGRKDCPTPALCADPIEAAANAARAGQLYWPLHRIDDFRPAEPADSAEEPLSDEGRAVCATLVVLGLMLFVGLLALALRGLV